MSVSKSRIQSDIDFDIAGKQTSILRLINSDNRTPWGVIPVPIAVIAGGDFDRENTVLLSAGNHGDEYEGQIILRKLIDQLDPAEINGRIIILPALNYPAVLERSRVSDLDSVNMNRAFPGSAEGTPTYAMAYHVESEILPLCRAAVDLHSGGRVSSYLPCGYLRKSADTDFMQKKLDACDAFAAPYTVVVSNTADHRSLSAACDRNEIIMVATELAGSAHVDLDAMQVGYDGVMRYLKHFGVIENAPDTNASTRYIETPSADYFVWATADGIFEPTIKLGDVVEAGQTAGFIYPLNDPFRSPGTLYFTQSGIVAAIHTPAIVHRGQYVFQVAKEVAAENLL